MVENTLKRIYALTPFDFEVIIVSPHHFSGPKIVHVPEDNPQGCNAAFDMAWKASRGEFVLSMTDDTLVQPGWLDGVAETLREKERHHFPFLAGITHAPLFGTCYGLYYPNFPVGSRRSVEAIGGWYSTDYIHQWADPDIGMRTWFHGGRCEILLNNHIMHDPHEDESTAAPHHHNTFERDMTTFRNKWHPHFGAGFTHEFRNFNMNYPFEYLTDNTFMERVPPEVVMARRPGAEEPEDVMVRRMVREREDPVDVKARRLALDGVPPAAAPAPQPARSGFGALLRRWVPGFGARRS